MKTHMICVDVETGGLDHLKHALLSVAAVDSVTGEQFVALIAPEPEWIVEEQALGVNGFTLEFLKKHGRPEWDVMSDLCLWMGMRRDAVLAGCNVAFDRNFLIAACLRHKFTWPMSHRTLDIRGAAWLAWEAGVLDLPLGKSGQPKLDLDAIAAACGCGRTKKSHDALEDALLTLTAFEHLTNTLGQTRPQPTETEKHEQ